MAKYTVTYSCGHEGVVQLFGKNADRERKLHWMEHTWVCPECFKARISEEREDERKQAEENAEKLALPDLEGTYKQVNWAVTIRDKSVARIAEMVEATRKAGNSTPEQESRLNKFIAAQNKAAYWIDRRSIDPLHIIHEAMGMDVASRYNLRSKPEEVLA